MAGVAVAALVGGMIGEGVLTRTVGVSSGGMDVWVGETGGTGDAVAEGAWVAGREAGLSVCCHIRPKISRAMASAPESTESSTEPRACII